MAHDVFISYSHKDKTVADAICFALEENGIRCWYAPRDIKPGEPWAGAIAEAIPQGKALVLVFTDFSNKSAQVKREVDLAVGNGLVIIPFKLTETAPQGGLSYYLSTVHWLDALTEPLGKSIAALVKMAAAVLSVEADDKTEQRLAEKYKGRLAYNEPKRLLGFRSGKWWAKLLTSLYFAAFAVAAIYFFYLFTTYFLKRNDFIIGFLSLATIAAPYVILSLFSGKSRGRFKSVVCVLLAMVFLGGSLTGMLLLSENRFVSQTIEAKEETMNTLINSENPDYGNTASNLINGGYAVKSGNYLYFRDDSKSRYGAVSRMDLATFEIEKLEIGQRIKALNAVGDSIYYSRDISAGRGECNISEFETDTDNNWLRSDEWVSRMMMVDDIVVFIDDTNNNIYYRIINKYTTKTLITKTGGEPDKLAVSGQWAYYLLIDTDELCRVQFDGKGKEVVAQNVQSYQLSDDILYFRCRGSLEVVAVGLDGKNETVIADKVAGDFLVADGNLFYKNATDNSFLYCLDLKTNTNIKLCEDSFDVLAGIDGYVYGFSNSGSVFRIKADGMDYRKIQ